MMTTKTTMKNTTISSNSIALLMMMIFSHAHAATIIPQNGTVVQAGTVYYEQTVEYYAQALADVETLVRFYTHLSSLSFSPRIRKNGRRTGRDAQKCGGNHRARRERRVFKSSRYTRLWSSRASFSRLSLDDDDDDDDGFVRNSKFARENKTARRAKRYDDDDYDDYDADADDFYFLSLFISLSRAHKHIQMHYTDDRTFIEYSRNKREPGFARLVRRDELLLHKNREDGGRSGAVCRSSGRQSGYTSGDLSIVEHEHVVD